MAERGVGWFKGFLQGWFSPRKPPGATTNSPSPAQPVQPAPAVEPVQAAALGSTSAGAAAAAATTAPPESADPPSLDSPDADTFLGEDAGSLTTASGAVDPAATGLEVPGEPPAGEPAPPKPRKAPGTRKAAKPAAESPVSGDEATAKPARKRPAKAPAGGADAAAPAKRPRAKAPATGGAATAEAPKPARKRAPKSTPPSA